VHLSSEIEKLIEVFAIPLAHPAPNIAASWNVAPTDPLPVVRYNGKTGERSLDVLRWGLVPFWSKDIKVGFANINAKAEGIDTRPAFREAFQRRRCLVPVDNFYEWAKTPADKQPYAIALADCGIMALAGLWETWRAPAGEWVRSFAIVTTVPNALCCEIHNCSGLQSSGLRLAIIGNFWLTLGEIVGRVWLTLGDPRLAIIETGLHSSAPAHVL
jgi:putative SOS response-associated peptidase YedK